MENFPFMWRSGAVVARQPHKLKVAFWFESRLRNQVVRPTCHKSDVRLKRETCINITLSLIVEVATIQVSDHNLVLINILEDNKCKSKGKQWRDTTLGGGGPQ